MSTSWVAALASNLAAPFHEVQFPTTISWGAKGGSGYKTNVSDLTSGWEQRESNWAVQRATYEVSHTLKDPTTVLELLTFFYCRRGRAHGFRFKDWGDYQVNGLVANGAVNGVMVAIAGGFQLAKLYPDADNPYTRPITKPCSGLVTDDSDHTPPIPKLYDSTGALLVGNIGNPTQLVIQPSIYISGEGSVAEDLLLWSSGQQFTSNMEGESITLTSDTGSSIATVVDVVSPTVLSLNVNFGSTPVDCSWQLVEAQGYAQRSGGVATVYFPGAVPSWLTPGTYISVNLSDSSFNASSVEVSSTGTGYVIGGVTMSAVAWETGAGNLAQEPISGTITDINYDYALDCTTGIVTPARSLSTPLTWTGEFDVPARFDVDDCQFELRAFEDGNWENIRIVELWRNPLAAAPGQIQGGGWSQITILNISQGVLHSASPGILPTPLKIPPTTPGSWLIVMVAVLGDDGTHGTVTAVSDGPAFWGGGVQSVDTFVASGAAAVDNATSTGNKGETDIWYAEDGSGGNTQVFVTFPWAYADALVWVIEVGGLSALDIFAHLSNEAPTYALAGPQLNGTASAELFLAVQMSEGPLILVNPLAWNWDGVDTGAFPGSGAAAHIISSTPPSLSINSATRSGQTVTLRFTSSSMPVWLVPGVYVTVSTGSPPDSNFPGGTFLVTAVSGPTGGYCYLSYTQSGSAVTDSISGTAILQNQPSFVNASSSGTLLASQQGGSSNLRQRINLLPPAGGCISAAGFR